MAPRYSASVAYGMGSLHVRSNLQVLQKRDAFLRKIHVLFDVVTLHAADLRRLERLDPIDAAFADRYLGAVEAAALLAVRVGPPSVQIDVLHVHRVEPAGIFLEVVRGHEAPPD